MSTTIQDALNAKRSGTNHIAGLPDPSTVPVGSLVSFKREGKRIVGRVIAHARGYCIVQDEFYRWEVGPEEITVLTRPPVGSLVRFINWGREFTGQVYGYDDKDTATVQLDDGHVTVISTSALAVIAQPATVTPEATTPAIPLDILGRIRQAQDQRRAEQVSYSDSQAVFAASLPAPPVNDADPTDEDEANALALFAAAKLAVQDCEHTAWRDGTLRVLAMLLAEIRTLRAAPQVEAASTPITTPTEPATKPVPVFRVWGE